ncbi:MAG: EAL domain-containing protein [Gammaproteobacteria bacterium]|nr:EAL domain-containing protein [Gammaproteobacteria bacterium]
MKLQSKVIGLLVPIVIIPILVLGWIAFQKLYETYQKENIDKISALQGQILLHLNKTLEYANANIKLLSESEALIRYVLTDDKEERYYLMQRPLQRKIINYQNAYPEYYEIRIIMPDGYEELRQVNKSIKNKVEEESGALFFKNMIDSKKDVFSMVTRNPDNNEIVMYVGKRLMLFNRATQSVNTIKELKAYVVLTISMDFLFKHLDETKVENHEHLLVTDENGKIWFYTKGDRHADDEHHELLKDMVGKSIPKDIFSTLKTHAQNEEIFSGKFFNEKSMVIGKYLDSNMYLFSWVPNDDLLPESNRLVKLVAIIVLLTIVTTGGLIFAVLKVFVLRPIEKLDMAARKICEGKLIDEVILDSSDEMGSLAKTFCEMSANVKISNDQARHIAYHDNLTGLPNRLMFREYLEHYIATAKRKKERLALLFLDVDNFKWVNDTLGHHIGDELLKEFSTRLDKTVREEDYIAQIDSINNDDIIARLGGDEFIILITDISDNFVPGNVAERILKCMRPTFVLEGKEVHAGVSIGATIFPDDGEDPDVLIRNADIAMYHAKKMGKNNYQYFSDSMNEAVQSRHAMEHLIRKAIDEKQFELYYQPQINVRTNEITGVEALIRWDAPGQGFIPPDKFIPIAEETGLILQIGEWVLDEACRQNRVWRDQGYENIRVAINVSSIQFLRQDMPSLIKHYLQKHTLKPNSIEIELTENIYMHNEKHVTNTMSSIRNLGIHIALDDFGTGYSSLAYLRRFPIDVLKIDRSFINEINKSSEGEAVINAIIRMAHAMNLEVVAEGVEDEVQLRFLKSKGCDCVQGYYYYRPMPAEDIGPLLKENMSSQPLAKKK